MLPEAFGDQVIGDSDCVGDDGEGWIDGAGGDEAGGINNVEVIEVVGFAMGIEDAGCRVAAHAACAVLMADAFKGDALFEVGVERNGSGGVAGPLENVDPTVFEAIEGLDVVGGIGELDSAGRGVGDGLGLVGAAGVS